MIFILLESYDLLYLFLIVVIVDFHYLSFKVDASLFVIDYATTNLSPGYINDFWIFRSYYFLFLNENLLPLILAFSVYIERDGRLFYLGWGFNAAGLSYFLMDKDFILFYLSFFSAYLALSVL